MLEFRLGPGGEVVCGWCGADLPGASPQVPAGTLGEAGWQETHRSAGCCHRAGPPGGDSEQREGPADTLHTPGNTSRENLYSSRKLFWISFHISAQDSPKNLLSSSNYWVVAANSLTDFENSVLELDIPIDSNLLVYTGDTEHQAEVWDVYRAQPGAELRSAVSSLQSAVPSSHHTQAVPLGGLEAAVRPRGPAGSQVGDQEGLDWGRLPYLHHS